MHSFIYEKKKGEDSFEKAGEMPAEALFKDEEQHGSV